MAHKLSETNSVSTEPISLLAVSQVARRWLCVCLGRKAKAMLDHLCYSVPLLYPSEQEAKVQKVVRLIECDAVSQHQARFSL